MFIKQTTNRSVYAASDNASNRIGYVVLIEGAVMLVKQVAQRHIVLVEQMTVGFVVLVEQATNYTGRPIDATVHQATDRTSDVVLIEVVARFVCPEQMYV